MLKTKHAGWHPCPAPPSLMQDLLLVATLSLPNRIILEVSEHTDHSADRGNLHAAKAIAVVWRVQVKASRFTMLC
jgi:hypothetical protein